MSTPKSPTCPSEPTSLTAGFGTSWRRTVRGFPSASNTLNYTFRPLDGSTAPVTIQAQPDGLETYKVTLTPAETATLTATTHSLTGYITDDATGGVTTKQIVYQGVLSVKPDPLTAPGNLATDSQQILAALKDAMKKLAGKTLSSVSVNGKSYTTRNQTDLYHDIQRWEEIVRREQQEEALSAACRNPNRILIRNLPTL